MVEFVPARDDLHVVLGGVSEEMVAQKGRERSPEEIEEVTAADVGFMMAVARAWGIPMYLVEYIRLGSERIAVRRALERVAAEWGLPTVETNGAERIAARTSPPGTVFYDPYLHPMGPIYRVVAMRVYKLLVVQGVVTPAP